MINSFITYLIESTICFTILYSFYKYVFYQSTHFNWNRWYFIITVIVCLVIPFVPFPFSIGNQSAGNNVLMISPADGTGLMVYSKSHSFWDYFKFLSQNPYFNINNLLMVVYFSGLLRYVIVFSRQNIKISKLISNSEFKNIGKFKLTIINSKTTAFSWFYYIFINKNFFKLPTEEQAQIIEHEKIHARDLHSLDILLYELLELLFWFNPIIRKAKQTLKNIHEFIVDAEITSSVDPEEYSNLLIKLSSSNANPDLVNCFSKTPLFDRIWLLAFPTSKKLQKLRFMAGIPLLIAVMISYSFLISEINRNTERLQLFGESNFEMPVRGEYQIVSLFFEKKALHDYNRDKNADYKVMISHPEVAFSVESFMPVYAVKDGMVTEVKEVDNWGVKEIEITIKHKINFESKYKGLWKSSVAVGEKVGKGQEVALTGDNRLYPTISYQLLLKDKPVDPFKYIKY